MRKILVTVPESGTVVNQLHSHLENERNTNKKPVIKRPQIIPGVVTKRNDNKNNRSVHVLECKILTLIFLVKRHGDKNINKILATVPEREQPVER